ncbi:MAG: protease pro-enzyme activation domain-containing protein, partial [Verrucomicrobiota bacterium]
MQWTRWFFAAGISFGLLSAGIVSAVAAGPGRQMLHGHVPAAVGKLSAVGNFPPTNQLHLAIGLPLRNPAALDELLQQIYDPASPKFRQYLTPGQFTEQFGPTESDYQRVIAFAQSNGLTVTATHGNRVLLDVSGSVWAIEKMFNVTLRLYQHPREPREFFAPDVEPSVDLDVPLADVSGLNNYA